MNILDAKPRLPVCCRYCERRDSAFSRAVQIGKKVVSCRVHEIALAECEKCLVTGVSFDRFCVGS